MAPFAAGATDPLEGAAALGVASSGRRALAARGVQSG
jgi:hypothetical protein